MNHRAIASALVTLATVLGVTAATATAGAAAPARPAAAPPAARELFGVSCRTAANCLAVGIDQNAFKGMGGPLAEKWNGRAWQTVAVKLPAGATGGALGRISCVSATHCVAVGFFDKGGPAHQFALAETWNGSSWTPSEPPAPGGASTSLSGVSCKSATACVAVGAYTKNASGGAPLAETWNGRKWTEARPPAPGAVISGLDSVSCTSAASCVATGIFITNTVSAVLIESWNGRSWSRMRPAALPATTLGELNTVSCPAARSCDAVGYAASSKGLGSLAETWNGKAWTLTTLHWPKGTSNELLFSVSCAATSRCVLVGNIDSNLNLTSNSGKAAAATWNGRAWTVTSVPAPAKGKASLLRDVTCLSAANCVAVGQAGPSGSTNGTGLSAFWNGKSWRLVAAK